MTSHHPNLRWLRPLLLALMSAAATAGVWWWFVDTADGQRMDTISYLSAQLGADRIAPQLESVLTKVSVGAIAVAMAGVALVALLRRRWMLALEAMILIGGANLTTRVLKYHVFYRRVLVEYPGLHNNSLPSGHTTAAASAMVAAVLVAPRGMRSLVAVLGSLVMILFGYGTLVSHWHRPSDIVAAYLVCLAWGFGALFVAALRRRVMRTPAGRATGAQVERPSSVVAVLMVLAGLVALGIAAWCGVQTLAIDNVYPEDLRDRWIAYLGGASGLCGVAVTGMGVLLRQVQLHDARTTALS